MKKIILFFAVVALALPACAASVDKDELNIVTYNVGAFKKYLDNSTGTVAEMLKELKADAVSLNELDSVNTRTGRRNQIADLADSLGGGWSFNFSRAMPFAGGAYGIGTMAAPRHKVIAKYSLILPKCDGSEPRALSVIETEKFVMASTHLDHMSDSARVAQAKVITDWMKERYAKSKKAVILAGDFNDSPDSKVIAYMSENWNIISDMKNFTFSSRKPRSCIDYIMVLKNRAKYTVKGSKVCKELKAGDVKMTSDHLPVCATIILK